MRTHVFFGIIQQTIAKNEALVINSDVKYKGHLGSLSKNISFNEQESIGAH